MFNSRVYICVMEYLKYINEVVFADNAFVWTFIVYVSILDVTKPILIKLNVFVIGKLPSYAKNCTHFLLFKDKEQYRWSSLKSETFMFIEGFANFIFVDTSSYYMLRSYILFKK